MKSRFKSELIAGGILGAVPVMALLLSYAFNWVWHGTPFYRGEFSYWPLVLTLMPFSSLMQHMSDSLPSVLARSPWFMHVTMVGFTVLGAAFYFCAGFFLLPAVSFLACLVARKPDPPAES